MVKKNKSFGPKSYKEELVFAEEDYKIDLQCEVNSLMLEKGISKTDLAKLTELNISEINNFFSDNCNVSIRTVGRILYVLKK